MTELKILMIVAMVVAGVILAINIAASTRKHTAATDTMEGDPHDYEFFEGEDGEDFDIETIYVAGEEDEEEDSEDEDEETGDESPPSDEERSWSSAQTIKKVILAGLIVAMIALIACWVPSCSTQAPDEGDGTKTEQGQDNVTEEQIRAAQEALTVTEEDMENFMASEYYANVSKRVLMSSFPIEDGERTRATGFSDALTYGFVAADDAGRFSELKEEILRNPVYGVTVANAIRNKTIGQKRIGDFNPWMDEMVDLTEKEGVLRWITEGDKENTFNLKDEYEKYAVKLCVFLERLVPQGIHSWQTIENWCLNLTTDFNGRAGVPADYQYTKEALILSFVGKDVGAGNGTTDGGDGAMDVNIPVGMFTIGFNLHDKRPEFYGKEVKQPTDKAEEPAPVEEKPDKPKEEKKSDPPSGDKGDDPKPATGKKNPAIDPVNQGNAQKGGGQNKAADKSGEVQKTDPRNEKPVGTGNNNNKGHSDPATVQPQTPPQTQAHQGQETVDHETKMDYKPKPDQPSQRGSTSGQQPTSSGGDGAFTPDD